MSSYLLIVPNPGLSTTARMFVCNDNIARDVRGYTEEQKAPKSERTTTYKTQKAAKDVVETVFSLNPEVQELQLTKIWCGGCSVIEIFTREA